MLMWLKKPVSLKAHFSTGQIGQWNLGTHLPIMSLLGQRVSTHGLVSGTKMEYLRWIEPGTHIAVCGSS